jgi:hypothetical protein
MAGLRELNSFIGKFVSLWQAGHEANLHLNSIAGQAHVNLQVGLGKVQPLPHLRRVPGPARVRRRERRTEARHAAGEATSDRETAAESVAKEVHEVTSEMAEEAVENVEAQHAIDRVDTSDFNAVNDAIGSNEVETNAATEILVDEVCLDEEYLYLQARETNGHDTATTNNENEFESKNEENLTIVNGIAIFENSPDIGISEDDINSLHKFICSEQDFRENIAKIELDVKSKSEIFVKLHVRRARLREGARSYVWKHLGGDNFWTKQNGTKIKLVKIHEFRL